MHLSRSTSRRLTAALNWLPGNHCACEKPIFNLGYAQDIPAMRLGTIDAQENRFMT